MAWRTVGECRSHDAIDTEARPKDRRARLIADLIRSIFAPMRTLDIAQ
jgi:hypothetical protein